MGCPNTGLPDRNCSIMKCKHCGGTGVARPKNDTGWLVLQLREAGLSLRQIAKKVGLSSASNVKYYLDKYQ